MDIQRRIINNTWKGTCPLFRPSQNSQEEEDGENCSKEDHLFMLGETVFVDSAWENYGVRSEDILEKAWGKWYKLCRKIKYVTLYGKRGEILILFKIMSEIFQWSIEYFYARLILSETTLVRNNGKYKMLHELFFAFFSDNKIQCERSFIW